MVDGGRARDHRRINESTDPSARPSEGQATGSRPSLRRPRREFRDHVRAHWQEAQATAGQAAAQGWSEHRHRHRHRGLLHLRGMRRNPDTRVLGGVCGGISAATGIDVMFVRLGFVILGVAIGWPVLVYVVAWLIVPIEGETSNIYSRAINDRRGIRLLIAVIPVLVVVQIIVSALHVGYIGLFGWPVVLAAWLAIMIWRNVSDQEKVWINQDVMPMLRAGEGGLARRSLLWRLVLGAVLAAAGVAVVVFGHTKLSALRPLGGVLLVIAAIVVIFGPWWLSLARDLMSERQARARAEERAEMAAHVHDSVLQTLALIQRAADDPQHVVRLARAQERELRAWLFEGKEPGSIGEDATMLAEGVSLLQRNVEADHGITVQVVMVGDCALDEGLRALLDAAREATVNAAKWSGAPQVSLYAEVEPDAVMLFVRDRGQGFDPENVPGDRQGIAQSIRARMARYGGAVVIRSSPGNGAEVELSMAHPSGPPSGSR
jgi:signal transduction histidine kinase/phage shock protein PspC (stress-responsive transcriptional regulator)